MVERAVAAGLAAIAITDHDTLDGVEEGAVAARDARLEFLSGVEISSGFVGHEVHIVGLGVDCRHEGLRSVLKEQTDCRNRRADLIIEKLHVLGVPVDRELIEGRTVGGIVGRMHIAQEIHRIGYASTVQEAFDKYIGAGKAAYVRKATLSAAESIDLIHAAHGLAILAHPGIGRTGQILSRLLRLPFDGIEAYHCKHSPGQIEEFMRIAREGGLLVSGGSDCHGQAKNKPEMGNVLVPYEHFTHLCDALSARGLRPGVQSPTAAETSSD